MIEYIKLTDICNPKQWKTISGKNLKSDGYPVYGANGVIGYYNLYTHEYPTLMIGCRGTCGTLNISVPNSYINGNAMALDDLNQELIDIKYLFYYLSFRGFKDIISGSSQPQITRTALSKVDIPLIPMPLQMKIVNILDKSQELLDKRKAQIEVLDELIQSVFYDMFGDPILNSKKLPVISLGDLGEWRSGGTPSRSCSEYYNGDIPWLSSGELNSIYVYDSIEKITEDAIENSSTKLIDKGSLLLGMYDTAALKSTITKIDCTCNQAIAFSKLNDSLVNTIFVYYCIQFGRDFYKSQQRGVRQKNLNLSMIKDIKILYPNLDQQHLFTEKVHQIHMQKQLLNESLVELQNNFNSLMQRAFNGESLC